MPLPEIRHLQEPKRLTLAWIPPLANGTENRTWRRVGELVRGPAPEATILNYLTGEADYNEAIRQGFRGHPAFPIETPSHRQGVIESLLKRLPPRSRKDFPEYLGMFRLPVNTVISDFALLGYTGARLPSDDFAVLLPLEDFVPPYEIVAEVAGFRHESEVTPDQLQVGEAVTLQCEAHPKDADAVNVLWHGKKLGHILRLHAKAVGRLVREGRVEATIVRVNGSAERPVVRLFLSVR